MRINNNLQKKIVIQKVFSLEECEKIIISKTLGNEKKAFIGDFEYRPNIRDTNISYLVKSQENNWIPQRLLKHIVDINNNYFQFHIKFLSELQILKYTENNHFNWHMDIGPNNIEMATRKLSVIVLLSDKKNFEGGKLLWMNNKNNDIELDIGDIVIFPSYQLHKVEKVTKGCRYSLVGWVHGNVLK